MEKISEKADQEKVSKASEQLKREWRTSPKALGLTWIMSAIGAFIVFYLVKNDLVLSLVLALVVATAYTLYKRR